jgi:phosphoribosyl-AMP cyclohydrolase
MTTFQSPPKDKAKLEGAGDFTPRFDANGLVTAVVTDIRDGELLMVAHMNEEALALTVETGIAHYYSRSRASLWKKGESSGNLQTVHELRTDCDQDVVWLKVSMAGHDAACHTGRRSCFYRVLRKSDTGPLLEIDGSARHFDPADVYSGKADE